MQTSIIIVTPEALQELIVAAVEKSISGLLEATGRAAPIEIINTEQLCAKLNISPTTAIRYRKKGKIPFLLIGDSIRYNWPDVIEAIKQKGKNKTK